MQGKLGFLHTVVLRIYGVIVSSSKIGLFKNGFVEKCLREVTIIKCCGGKVCLSKVSFLYLAVFESRGFQRHFEKRAIIHYAIIKICRKQEAGAITEVQPKQLTSFESDVVHSGTAKLRIAQVTIAKAALAESRVAQVDAR